MESMRHSTVWQKRERLDAAAAGDSTAAAAGGEEAAAGPQEEAWQEVNKKFDAFVNMIKFDKFNLNTRIPVETAKMCGNVLGKFDVVAALGQARPKAQVRAKVRIKEMFPAETATGDEDTSTRVANNIWTNLHPVLEEVYAEGVSAALAADQEKMMDAVQTAVTREVSTLQAEIRLQLDEANASSAPLRSTIFFSLGFYP